MSWFFSAMGVSAAVTAVCGLFMIPMLRRLKFGQSILEEGPKWHMSKQGTPTMGGFLFMSGITAAVVIIGLPLMLGGRMDALGGLLFAWLCGLIGFVDDLAKVRKKRNQGLTALQKLLLQLSAAAMFLAYLRFAGLLTTDVYIPFWGESIALPWLVYLGIGIVYVTGFINAVNLTDGIDGLCSGVTLPIAVTLGLIALKNEQTGAVMLAAAVAGGVAAFLIYNFKPARVFMGDTGSLFLGGSLCGLAFMLDRPLLLIPLGLIYLFEMFSVIMQVGYFKLSGGKRIFKMAPVHHHFEMCGWSEIKIFAVFSGITTVFCAIVYLWA